MQNGYREAKKERKKILSRIPFVVNPGKKIPKKIAKKIQNIRKLKTGIISFQKGLREDKEKKKKI